MKYFLIINPASKSGKSKNKIEKLLEILSAKNIEYKHIYTTSLESAYDLSVMANSENYDVITAVGGDGTINRVINGFYDKDGRRISNSKFAVIYTGTSPDFCKSYKIPIKLEKAIETMLKGNMREIPIGKINHSTNNIEDNKINFFACCANIGIGPLLAEKANGGIRKYLGDLLGTFISLIMILIKFKPSDYLVKIDGAEKKIKKVYNISVGITQYIASGIKINNELTTNDNRFYGVFAKNLKIGNWLQLIRKIYSGKKFENNNVLSLDYFEKIEVLKSSGNNELEFDGDSEGFIPCSISYANDKLPLICEVYDE